MVPINSFKTTTYATTVWIRLTPPHKSSRPPIYLWFGAESRPRKTILIVLTTTVKDCSISYNHCVYSSLCVSRRLYILYYYYIVFDGTIYGRQTLATLDLIRSTVPDRNRGFFGTTRGFNGIECQTKTRARFMIYQIVFHTRPETRKNFSTWPSGAVLFTNLFQTNHRIPI